MRVVFKTFESQFATRQKILQKAAGFASELGAERLINITHSEDHNNSIITIWYWAGEGEKDVPVPAGSASEADGRRASDFS